MQIRNSMKGIFLMGLMVACLITAAGLPAATAAAEPGISTPMDLNSAGPETLATLPGIGSVKADAIVSFRAENGPFASIDGLLAVPGIGPRLLESVRGLIAIPSR